MGVPTRIGARIPPTVLKTCFAEETLTASPFEVLVLSSMNDASAMRTCVAVSSARWEGYQ